MHSPTLTVLCTWHTDPVTYAHANTHTAKSYFHTNSHTECCSLAIHRPCQILSLYLKTFITYCPLPPQTCASFSSFPPSTLCLSHTQSQLHSPNFPLPTPADIHTKVKASSSGLLNHRNASSNNCFLIHNCHFFLKNLYCSVVDYNVVLVPGVRQSEPVICIHTGTPLQILCQYRLLQSTE